jgi:hypothetical protein
VELLIDQVMGEGNVIRCTADPIACSGTLSASPAQQGMAGGT